MAHHKAGEPLEFLGMPVAVQGPVFTPEIIVDPPELLGISMDFRAFVEKELLRIFDHRDVLGFVLLFRLFLSEVVEDVGDVGYGGLPDGVATDAVALHHAHADQQVGKFTRTGLFLPLEERVFKR